MPVRPDILFADPGNALQISANDVAIESTKEIQQALKTIGYYQGAIDGIVGRGTGFAILRFYRAAGYNISLATLARGLSQDQMMVLVASAHMINGRGVSLDQSLRDFPAFKAAFDIDTKAHTAFAAGKFVDAREMYTTAYREYARYLGENDRFTLVTANGLGGSYLRLGNTLKAQQILRDTLARQRITRGPNHIETLNTEQVLALVALQNGNYAQAELLLRKNLNDTERLLGPNKPQTLSALNNLAVAISAQGRLREAEGLFQEYLTRSTALNGEKAPQTILATANLSASKMTTGDLDEAELLGQRARRIAQAELGIDSSVTLRTMVQLANVFYEQDRFAEARALFEQILPKLVGAQGLRSSSVARVKLLLARVFVAQDKYKDAETLARDARKTFIRSGLPWSQERLAASLVVADALRGLGKLDQSEREYQKVLGLIDEYIAAFSSIPDGVWLASIEPVAGYFALQEMKQDKGIAAGAAGFEMQSWWTFSNIDVSLNDLGGRLSLSDPADVALLRAFQERRDSAAGLRADYSRALQQGLSGAERNSMAANLEAVDRQLVKLQNQVIRQLPEISDLLLPRAMTASEVQQLLQPGEGLVAYAVTRDRLYAWLVSDDRVQWRGIDISRKDLISRVKRLRQSVDLSQPAPAVLPSAACAVNSDAPLLAGRPFDACAAQDLYDDLLGQFDLSDIQHLIVAPDGPLETLPFSLLVTRLVLGEKPQWLIEERSVSRIPTTASLRALRAKRTARPAAARKPFLGIAPGEFTAHASNSPLTSVPANLPGTVVEVTQLARILGAQPDAIVTGPAASELFVEMTDLSDYRIISFATHGLMTREAEAWTKGAIAEPALVLSGAGGFGDGLLTASEAAKLRLNADWVLLSGCNTAAGSGEDAKGLSGLARAFFFAGAKSLLVSHWSIEDSSALLLMANAMQTSRPDSRFSKAAALQTAVLRLKNTPGYGHPYFWAPFELVGEGLGPANSDRQLVLNADSAVSATAFAPFQTAALETGNPSIASPLRGSLQAPAPNANIIVPTVGSKTTEASLSLSRSDRVELQVRLKLLNFDPKGADGAFGPNSRAAIAQWQQAQGLPTSGFFNADQLGQLKKSSEVQYQEWHVANPNFTGRSRRRVRKCSNFLLFKICNSR